MRLQLGDYKMTKNELENIVENDYALPEDLSEMESVRRVLSVFSSSDPELRDKLGYRIVYNWLLNKMFLTSKELMILLDESLSESKLLHKLGENEDDSVFLRSFTSLFIALVLIRDNKNPFLTYDQFSNVVNTLKYYCQNEMDQRGYVEGKGWAHSAAHIADALDECVRSKHATEDECLDVFHSIIALILNSEHVYNTEEDERMAIAIAAMLELEKVSLELVIQWFQNVKIQDNGFDSKRTNLKHLIRSLYFRLLNKDNINQEKMYLFVELEKKFNYYLKY